MVSIWSGVATLFPQAGILVSQAKPAEFSETNITLGALWQYLKLRTLKLINQRFGFCTEVGAGKLIKSGVVFLRCIVMLYLPQLAASGLCFGC